jgi:membrane dipeptidase
VAGFYLVGHFETMKFLLFLLCITILACAPSKKVMMQSDQNMYQYAVELAHRFIITDGHVDLPYRLQVKNFRLDKEYLGIPISTTDGDFDYERAKQGGLDAPFMSIFIPSSYQNDLPSAKALADTLIYMIDGIITAHPDKFAKGDSPEMIEANFEKGLISLPMGMENGAPLITLDDIQYYYNKGIRYVTLTHGKDNHICDSSYDTTKTWGGLSPYGFEVIAEMNKIGMIIDVSHISDKTFYQVMEHSKAPVLATHSSCRFFTPGWERNMSDDMIVELGKRGGVIQINFGSDFLDAEVTKGRTANRNELNARLEAAGLKGDDPLAKPIIEDFKKEHPELYSDVKRVADHIDHVKALAGIDHVGIGSDFDGVGDSLPTGLKDVSMYPNLIYELLKRDYSEEEIEKICFKNVWRVWNQVNEIATAE